MAVAIDPTMATQTSAHHVEIECASELTRGMTVVDRLNVSGDARNRGMWSELLNVPKTTVVWAIDIPRWKELLYKSLK
jgi:purine nucleosidase